MVNPGTKLEDVKTVSSMAIALGQCRRTIRRLGLATEAVGDTAGAARILSQNPDPTRAAIAPALAAEIYGLEILLRDIEDERHNTTRFMVMTGEKDPPAAPFTHRCVTSFVFRVGNMPAALYKALGGFATNGVNMTKLESYMEDGAFTATFFLCRGRRPPGRPQPGPGAEGTGLLRRAGGDPGGLSGRPVPRPEVALRTRSSPSSRG